MYYVGGEGINCERRCAPASAVEGPGKREGVGGRGWGGYGSPGIS